MTEKNRLTGGVVRGIDVPVPEKLSQLIRIAIEDGRGLNREEYEPDSSLYHMPLIGKAGDNQICYVCLGGAVMVETLNVDPSDSIWPSNLPARWHDAILALDRVRVGDYMEAVRIYTYPTIEDSIRLESEALKFEDVPGPADAHFFGFESFSAHLDSLEDIADQIEAIGY